MDSKNEIVYKPFIMQLNKIGIPAYFLLIAFLINVSVAGTMAGLIWSDSKAAIFPFGENTPAR